MSEAVGCNGRLATASLMVLVLVASIAGAVASRDLVVTSTADAGAGTLRWALQAARSGDVLTFDPSVFPPDSPATVNLESQLTIPWAGRIMIDASEAGVILDGTRIPRDEYGFNFALLIPSDGNTVMGLQIVNTFGAGIGVHGGHNTIGGDRDKGNGPTGQGNLLGGNGTGIILWNSGRGNVLLGNLVGTGDDATTAWGNACQGIWIENGAPETQIGPANTIAFNGCAGIEINGTQAYGNTITGNSIHSNAAGDIHIWDGANDGIEAPRILRYDPNTGDVEGLAPPLSVVEIYSSDGSGAEHFEGRTTADSDGGFRYSKRGPLFGMYPTALATDSGGNSSELCAVHMLPASFQVGVQALPRILQSKPSGDLKDNGIGGHWHGLWIHWDLSVLLDQVLSLGLKRYRFSINSMDLDSIDWDKPEFVIDPAHEEFLNALVESGIDVTFVLMYWDKEFVRSGGRLGSPRFESEEEIERYLRYVQFVARELGDRIQTFEVWNEPTAWSGTIQAIDIDTYLKLVERTVEAIRQEVPHARIVVGGTDYLIFDHSQNYLDATLRSSVMEIVDVVSWHPMYGGSPADGFHRDYYYDYPDLVREMRATAAGAGFAGEFVADEVTWRTPDTEIPDVEWPHVYSQVVACKYNLRGILTNLGLGVAVTQQWLEQTQVILLNGIRGLCNAMSEHTAIDLPVDVDIETDGPVAHCAFRYPNGDRVLAIWTDGIAQDEDPGVPATIKFPGLAAGTVTGIDVLHGFEQELLFDVEAGATKVRDLLVKDYPILIRLRDITFGPDYEETVGDGFHRIGDSDEVGGAMEDRDGDGVPDDEDFCPDWPGSEELNGC